MKKKVLIGVSGIFVIILGICICFYISKYNSDNEMYTSNIEDKKENSVGGFLTFMLETEAGSGTYEKSTSSTWPGEGYVFNGNLSSCENGGELSWNEELGAVNLKTNNTEKCYVYFDKEPDVIYLASYITSQYTTDGENGLYYHDADLANGAGDNSYRFSGANPNNYVCFGTDEVSCPEDNLYRIIGVFNGQVKLIKSTSYGKYVWESDWDTQGNTWDETTKPDIYTTLNTTYYNTLGSEWQSKIATHSWKVGGMARDTSATAKDYYDTEVGTGQSGYEETMKIGLMYVSDYGYGASEEYWTTELNNYEPTVDSNWMYLGAYEWLISRTSGAMSIAFFVSGTGYVYYYGVSNAGAVRPSFYLESDVTYASGSGSMTDPLKIN